MLGQVIQQYKIKVGILSEIVQWDKQEQVFVQQTCALTVLQNLGDRVVGVNFHAFIRSRDVGFTARGMKTGLLGLCFL